MERRLKALIVGFEVLNFRRQWRLRVLIAGLEVLNFRR